MSSYEIQYYIVRPYSKWLFCPFIMVKIAPIDGFKFLFYVQMYTISINNSVLVFCDKNQ